MSNNVTSADVIIAGAGPVGCTIALYLARQGISVILLEGDPALPLDLRASTIHPPTLDMLDDLGLAEKLIPQGLVAHHYQYRDRRTGDHATFDMRVLGNETRHPFRLQCEQFKLTQEAVKMLREYPHVKVLFDHRVEQVVQDEAGVTVFAEALADGFHEYRGKYCVGTDGANSRVRKSQAIDFQGFTWPERFLVVSTPFDLATLLPELTYVNYISDPDEWCVLLKTVALWRVLVPVDNTTPDAALLSEANAQKVLQRIAPRDVPYEVAHRTIYRVHQRVAVTYRKGRVLLAGDSAHINNPLGGMGMNGGLHDAFNLAPRLVAVLKGQSGEETLDQYDRQRREICVRFVQDQTIKNKKAIEEKDPKAREKQLAEYKRLAANPDLARDFLRRGAMITSLREAAEIA